MADFCNQCSEDLGLPPGDMKGITKPEDWAKGMSVVVLCEDCGPIQVDPDGNCISTDCYKKHGT
jgi:hypothetical protein